MADNAKERRILRALARKVAEYAAHPRNGQLREMWIRHNRLEKVKPMVLVFPEGAWEEILPPTCLQTNDPKWRSLERELRVRIYHAEHFHDDAVIDDVVRVPLVHRTTGWGLEAKFTQSSEERGAYAFESPLREPADMKKLHFPELIVEEEATQCDFEQVQELLGDILPVRVHRGVVEWCSVVGPFAYLRGLDQPMLDMCDRPRWVHEIMSFITEGQSRLLDQIEALGAVELNNGNDYVGSGGFGFSDELPAPGYQGKPRLRDRWGAAEAQEFALVSPDMLEEFVLPYQARLLERFGLNCYGCCEPLTHQLEKIIRRLPRLRRVSVSPWTDIRVAAEQLQDNYIYSWKPNPAEAIVTFDPERIRKSISETLQVAKDCVLEMILKDTHTVQHQPERLQTWVDIAQELAAESV